LLDKVVARRIMEALLKLASAQDLTAEEVDALSLYERADVRGIRLFMAPPTHHILERLVLSTQYAPLIALFRARAEVALPTRYFQRWSRRLRDQGFTREDAAVLALGTFGTSRAADVLGMHFVATLDQPMVNHWQTRQPAIRERLVAMQRQLNPPYRDAFLPQVRRPENITQETPGSQWVIHEGDADYEV
jgi:DNA-binding transcriptional MocR family regulator